jgi:hypothetical protein
MPVYESYSERKRRLATSGAPDVYRYDKLPEKLRIQFVHIFDEAFGSLYSEHGRRCWAYLENQIARSEGVKSLAPSNVTSERACELWIRAEPTDQVLSMIELGAQMMEANDQSSLIEELNLRFRQNGIGYQYEGEQIIRVDDQYIHAEIVKPAIAALSCNAAFKTANDEFMAAHKHYRDGANKDAVVAANRAFESTLKAICAVKGWTYESSARATDLIKVVRKHGLFPDYLDSAFDSYIAAMKSGLPGVRNEAGGHGGAPGDPQVPEYIAAYAIHLSAANIVLVIEAVNA